MSELDGWSDTVSPMGEELHTLDWARLGTYIKERREKLRLSQAALAVAADVSVSTVQNFEHGRVPDTWPRRLGRVTERLGWAPRSEEEILRGGDPTLRISGSQIDDDDSDLVYILSHIAHANPSTLRAMRAVLESDVAARTRAEED